MPNDEKLKPCPFCGAEVIYDFEVVGHPFDSRDCPLAYEAFGLREWNTRPLDPEWVRMQEALEAIRACYPKNSNAHRIASAALNSEVNHGTE